MACRWAPRTAVPPSGPAGAVAASRGSRAACSALFSNCWRTGLAMQMSGWIARVPSYAGSKSNALSSTT